VRLRMKSYHQIQLAILGLLVISCVAEDENEYDSYVVDGHDELNSTDYGEYDELDGTDYQMMMSDGRADSINEMMSDGRIMSDGRASSMPAWARPYTKDTTGCPCWWDLSLGDICACCKGENAQPCGYPKHNYCQRKRSIGCPGLLPQHGKRGNDYERYTLSTRGYPCHYDKSDTSCAWCVLGNQQCGKAGTWANNYLFKNRRLKKAFRRENTCLPVLNIDRKSFAKRPYIACLGQPQDCSEDSECDINAMCVDAWMKKALSKDKVWSVKRCKCKPGYVGNGITCADEKTGIVTRPGVEVKTKLTTDVWEQYKLDTTIEVEGNDDFMNSLDKLLKGGSCGAGCAADVVTCPA